MSDLYKTDFYGWTAEQAALLRGGNLSAAEITHIAEEIESMGCSEQEQLTNRLAVLLAHLLEWRYQPGLRGNSWRLTIAGQRRRIVRHIRKNPSLTAVFADAYCDAILVAERETGLADSTFPPVCPWSLEQSLQQVLD